LANCIDQKYSVQVSQASYPNLQAFVQSTEFCIVLKKLVRSCRSDRRQGLDKRYPELCPEVLNYVTPQNVSDANMSCPLYDGFDEVHYFSFSFQKLITTYASDNIAKVSIFLRDPYVKRYIREEKITEITFVGTVGGLLGLFLGFSFISGKDKIQN
jgi:hypothetical protein